MGRGWGGEAPPPLQDPKPSPLPLRKDDFLPLFPPDCLSLLKFLYLSWAVSDGKVLMALYNHPFRSFEKKKWENKQAYILKCGSMIQRSGKLCQNKEQKRQSP